LEVLNNLALGFQVALTGSNIVYCFLGALLGTLVGVLPGISPVTVIALLLPAVYSIGDPVTSIIFLAGIYYGSQYGGSTSAILLKIPGEAANLVTCIDGHAMTKKGRAGAALSIAALSSFFAGTVATVIIGLLAGPLSIMAFKFGPAEYASLMVLGLLAAVTLTNNNFLTGLAMVLIGILLGTIGTDVNSGITRFTFGNANLADGIGFAVLAVGLFGLGELLYNVIHEFYTKAVIPKLRDLYPTKKEFKDSINPTIRGTMLGSLLGVLPGAGPMLSSLASYVMEKRLSKNPKQFGHGAVAGIAGPEAANNASAQTSFIPMLSLGIPTTAVMALMIASLMMFGIQPGPRTISLNPELFWGLVASMWLGNFMLVILNLPLVGVWVSILKIPRPLLFSLITIGCVYGIYYINNNWFDVFLLIPLTIAGYIFKKLDCDPSPLIMGFVIGAMFEEYLRRALQIAQGNWAIFIDRPISLTFLLITVVLVTSGIIFKRKPR
jgi:TctA family transporter